VDVREFIQCNYTPYEGDSAFLVGPNRATTTLWEQVRALQRQERSKGGVLEVDTHIPSDMLSHKAGYINATLESIVGLQTDRPLKPAIMPMGGIRMVAEGLKAYGYAIDPGLQEIFTRYRKTHNQGVFDAYTPEMLAARRAGIITGLPDAYGRGRIIGDYRWVALYGVDRLIDERREMRVKTDRLQMTEAVIREREELADQIRALEDLKGMAGKYGYDISGLAGSAQEAVQWLYFGYLGAIKEQNGAAMSLGRVSTFLDIYITRDLEAGRLEEAQAQALIDQLVIKLRLVKFLRTQEYNSLLSGDPTWVTESLGGMGTDGRPLVAKTSFRFLQTLHNLGPAPEPNLTVLWSQALPQGFKDFCATTSIRSSSIQYQNDDVMRGYWGDDYGISCCVSPMPIGKQMQFFGAGANLAKCLLYALNGGRDELTGEQIGPALAPITSTTLD
jgi:formate C-acetyltransferase